MFLQDLGKYLGVKNALCFHNYLEFAQHFHSEVIEVSHRSGSMVAAYSSCGSCAHWHGTPARMWNIRDTEIWAKIFVKKKKSPFNFQWATQTLLLVLFMILQGFNLNWRNYLSLWHCQIRWISVLWVCSSDSGETDCYWLWLSLRSLSHF